MQEKEKEMRIAGVDIGGTSIKLGIFNQEGTMLEFIEYDTNSEQGGRSIIQHIIEKIEQFGAVDAIGVSTAGQVDNKRGIIVQGSANIPDTSGLQVKAMLEDHFTIPVAVENDVNAAALGENHFGVGKNLENFLFLTYGTGIGGAIVTDSEIFYGKSGFAGEFGHMITHGSGKQCGCGLLGCYETYASTTALVREAKKINSAYLNGKIIFEKYHDGDEEIKTVVHHWVDEIVIGLSSLIHIFNPPTIVIGGGIMEQEIIVQMISKQVKKNVLGSFSDVDIMKATLGNKAGMLGALSLHL